MSVAQKCTRQGLKCQLRTCGDERVDECSTALRQVSTRGSGPSKMSAHQVSYLAAPGGDSKGVHHVSGSGWMRLSAIMDSGSAECVVLEDIAKSIPVVGEQYRARVPDHLCDPTPQLRRVCDQGNIVLFTRTRGWIINYETGQHGVYVLHSWFPNGENVYDGQMIFFPGRSAKIQGTSGTSGLCNFFCCSG